MSKASTNTNKATGKPKMPKVNKATVKRLFGYIVGPYKLQLTVVLICLVLSALASVAGSLFLQTLIDDYILPLVQENNPVFSGLLRAILLMAGIYLIGVITNYLYNRIMLGVSQGTLKTIRDDMFGSYADPAYSVF